jgi:hypothetical protein
MKVAILAAVLVLGLSGCVVAPIPGYYGYQGYQAPIYATYPTYEAAYIWEPAIGAYYYRGPRGRVYMDRGWSYREHGRYGRWHRH